LKGTEVAANDRRRPFDLPFGIQVPQQLAVRRGEWATS
jgi:hypothetical protein